MHLLYIISKLTLLKVDLPLVSSVFAGTQIYSDIHYNNISFVKHFSKGEVCLTDKKKAMLGRNSIK